MVLCNFHPSNIHLEKDGEKRMQTKGVVQLVGSQGRSARQG